MKFDIFYQSFVVLCLVGPINAIAQMPKDGSVDQTTSDHRVVDGLLAIYDFSEDSGPVVYDRSGNKSPIDLKIENLKAVRRAPGSLTIRGETLVVSERPATRLNTAIKRSGEITIEAWLRPNELKQSGPARIVTLSKDSSNRNVTLGQDGDKFDVRFRTKRTNSNGLPSLATKAKAVKKEPTHVVYTRSRSGVARTFVNGKRSSQKNIEGNLSNWQSGYRLGLGNEINKSRRWKGTFFLVAIYSKALTPQQVERNYAAGFDGTVSGKSVAIRKQRDPKAAHFELEIASILSNHCLECHDTLTRKGGLDLSRKVAAFKGGDAGPSIVAGKPEDSLLWHSIESDEMPLERTPLSAKEKETVRRWIDDGAVWSTETIDPAVYVHGGRPDANWIRRLTIPEYVATVKDIFDVDVSNEASRLLPPDARADGFSNTAYNLTVDLKHVQAYQQLAEIIVGKIDPASFAEKYKRKLTFTDKAMAQFIANLGQRMFRGPLSDREVTVYHGMYTTLAATEQGNKAEAVSLIVEAMLQSPRFLYRVESQRGDGSEQPLSEYELASRLSYMVWGAPPDEELFDAAEEGLLFDTQSIGEQVQRMLKDPRAIEHSKRFFAEWLNLERLKNMQPNSEKFPRWNAVLAEDMRRESLAYFEEVVWNQKRPLSDLLNAKVTFATRRLAEHYGFEVKGANESADDALVRYDLTNSNRYGMLTHGSVLTVGGDEASMVTRGLLVMDELLRGVVKDPPACVDTTPVPTKAGLSQRAIAESRIANESCGGCHARFEPLAFGLEKYDGLGGYHEKDEHGNKLRDDGQIMIPGASKPVAYRNSGQLMDLLAGSDRVKESITWKLTQFALGRPLTAIDARAVQKIHKVAQTNGGTYTATMQAIATSDLVTMIRTE